MNLADFIAKEQKVTHDQIMLLRHSNRMVKKLLKAGASIEEDYTFVQPDNSSYDFRADGLTPISVLVVIVNDLVYGVYRIDGVLQRGMTHALTSPNYVAVDIAEGYSDTKAKKYAWSAFISKAQGRAVIGWTSPRTPVARYGHKMFKSVELV
jgi:hypothetical protein